MSARAGIPRDSSPDRLKPSRHFGPRFSGRTAADCAACRRAHSARTKSPIRHRLTVAGLGLALWMGVVPSAATVEAVWFPLRWAQVAHRAVHAGPTGHEDTARQIVGRRVLGTHRTTLGAGWAFPFGQSGVERDLHADDHSRAADRDQTRARLSRRGAEQNFTYIAALKPRMVFIIDIRRGNLLTQLM